MAERKQAASHPLKQRKQATALSLKKKIEMLDKLETSGKKTCQPPDKLERKNSDGLKGI